MPTIIERRRIPTSLHTQPDRRFLSTYSPIRSISAVLGLVLIGSAFSGCGNQASVSTSPQASGVTVPTVMATPSVSAALPSRSPEVTPSSGLPTGNWTGLHWTAAKTTANVWTQSNGSGPYATGNVTESGWAVFGWDKGYVAFDVITTKAKSGSETTIIETEHSTDGLSWSAGQSFSPPPVDPTNGTNSGVSGVLQGPAGLLAYDYTDCVCVCIVRIYPLAVSPDGVTWQTVKGSIVGNGLDAGPMGYIATEGTSVETSQDGINWTKTRLSGTTSARVGRVDSAEWFAGGFVAWSETHEGMSPSSMCGPYPIYDQPALWFSADGKTWTQQVLPNSYSGKVATGDICLVNGDLLLAEEWDGSGSPNKVWGSRDGTTWTPTDITCADFGGMAFAGHYLNNSFDPYGNWTLEVLGPDFQYQALSETGDLPNSQDVWAYHGWTDALGPAGLIVSDGLGGLWIGVPTAG
jgi:hypothetical protein